MLNFSDLTGHVFTQVEKVIDDYYGEMIIFTEVSGLKYKLAHCQDCCENVSIESIVGYLSDLVGTPILVAEEAYQDLPPIEEEYTPESYTWTFYKLRTIKGSVDIRFYGTSNGYYGESATLWLEGD